MEQWLASLNVTALVDGASMTGAVAHEVGGEAIAELAAAMQQGSRFAFAALYHRFHRVVHAVVLARVPACDAADVVQDVFAEAWVKRGALQTPAAFPGWLLALARHRAIDQARKVRTLDELDDVVATAPPTAEATAALRAIRTLPDTYRETLIMRLVEGLTGKEIAERTGMTPDSVRVHLHRGMALLRARLGGNKP